MDFFKRAKGFLYEPSNTFDASKEDTLSDAIKYYVSIALIYVIIFTVFNYFANDYFTNLLKGYGFWGLLIGLGYGADIGMILGVGSKIYYLIWIIMATLLTYFRFFGFLFLPALLFLSPILTVISEIRIVITAIIPVPIIAFPIMVLLSSIIGIIISSTIVHIGVRIVGGKKSIKQTIMALMYGSTPRLLLGWIPIIGIFAEIWSIVLYIIGIREFHGITTRNAILAITSIIVVTIYLAGGNASWAVFT